MTNTHPSKRGLIVLQITNIGTTELKYGHKFLWFRNKSTICWTTNWYRSAAYLPCCRCHGGVSFLSQNSDIGAYIPNWHRPHGAEPTFYPHCCRLAFHLSSPDTSYNRDRCQVNNGKWNVWQFEEYHLAELVDEWVLLSRSSQVCVPAIREVDVVEIQQWKSYLLLFCCCCCCYY
jgi:hypothetical protein